MSAARYRQALRILERWPIDPIKGDNRDIGILLRQRISASFKSGEHTEISDPEKCDKMLSSLENISLDKYKKQYSLAPELRIGSLLMELNDSRYLTSDEGVKQFKQDGEIGFFKGAKQVWFGSKAEDKSEERKVVH